MSENWFCLREYRFDESAVQVLQFNSKPDLRHLAEETVQFLNGSHSRSGRAYIGQRMGENGTPIVEMH